MRMNPQLPVRMAVPPGQLCAMANSSALVLQGCVLAVLQGKTWGPPSPAWGKPTEQSEREILQSTASLQWAACSCTAVIPSGAGLAKSAVLRAMMGFGFRRESDGDRDIMEESILNKGQLCFICLFCWYTSVCIRKTQTFHKQPNFFKGLETPRMFYSFSCCRYTTLDAQYLCKSGRIHMISLLGPNFQLSF